MPPPRSMRNRVTPLGDIVAIPMRGAWLGNRGILHEGTDVVRFHRSALWIICTLRHKDWQLPQWQPHHFTVLFFHDGDAVVRWTTEGVRTTAATTTHGHRQDDHASGDRRRPGRRLSNSGRRGRAVGLELARPRPVDVVVAVLSSSGPAIEILCDVGDGSGPSTSTRIAEVEIWIGKHRTHPLVAGDDRTLVHVSTHLPDKCVSPTRVVPDCSVKQRYIRSASDNRCAMRRTSGRSRSASSPGSSASTVMTPTG
jgi:hypothetical protein